jgi:vacuolar-type H+-ATPase subunit I/STV1
MANRPSFRLLPTKSGKASLHALTSSTYFDTHSPDEDIVQLEEKEDEEEVQQKHEPGTAALHGIYYPDTDYDYTQHLRKTGQYTDAITVLIPQQRRKKIQKQQGPPPEEKKEEWKKEIEEIDERLTKEDVQVILRTGDTENGMGKEKMEANQEAETKVERELEDILQMLDISGTGTTKRPRHTMNHKLFIGEHESAEEGENDFGLELEMSDGCVYTDDEYDEYQELEEYERVITEPFACLWHPAELY